MIVRRIAKNISFMGHESILQPNTLNLPDEEFYEVQDYQNKVLIKFIMK
ncbi:MAG: hypothetical protein WAK14_01675 [Methanobacterium sp.]